MQGSHCGCAWSVPHNRRRLMLPLCMGLGAAPAEFGQLGPSLAERV